jgi:HD-GYP domain-containing protein (c-di-GMP phosphodiesterase class II)
MKRIKITELEPDSFGKFALYHSSGEVLLAAHRTVTADMLRLFQEAGIEEVLSPEPGEDPGEFVHEAKNLVIPIASVNIGQRMTQPVFDRSGALLIEAGAVLSERMATSFRRRGVEEIYVRKNTRDLHLDQVQAFKRALRRLGTARPAPILEQLDDSRRISPAECTPKALDERLDAGGEVVIERSGTALAESIKQHDPMVPRSQEKKDGFLAMYESAIDETSSVFTAFEASREVPEEHIGNLARQIVGALIEDNELLLNLSCFKTEHNYLLGHSLGVTVLATSVAAAMGYNRKLVLEMGHAALLHDVGMLRVPKDIINKPARLTSQETLQIRHHPIWGLDMLQRLVGHRSGLAGTVPITAYQSHERVNGTGYPKKRKGTVIHDFAQIVSVCDAYEALTSRRAWRGPMLPYKAIEQLVLMAARGVYSSGVVKYLLQCLSLFPVGSWVELSDQGCARVVACSSDNYAQPVVSILFRKGEPLEKPERVDLSAEESISIARPVPEPQDIVDLMEGF